MRSTRRKQKYGGKCKVIEWDSEGDTIACFQDKCSIVTIIMSIISHGAYILSLNIGFTTRIATLVGIAVAVIVYFVLVVVFKILSKEDIYMLPNGEKIYKMLKKVKIYE